jgi:ribosome-associated toxin RatA of RatAB toxin-antitoxin module
MKHVHKSILLAYSPQEMFDLVIAVSDYPRFLPWCSSAEILETLDDGVVARMGLSYMGVRHKFTTRNHNVPGQLVSLALVDGPFSMLEGAWEFKPIERPGGDAPACRIEFDMKYEFSSRALEVVISPVFSRVVNTFVDCFVKRAEAVYGPR